LFCAVIPVLVQFSEALYLNDPDENGVELYCDRPEHLWPRNPDGTIEMYTKPLDINNLMSELQ
jgi:catechol 2,3-dioxygenase